MTLKVILNEEAYLGMILSAIQSYKKETLGIVIGKRIKREKSILYDTHARAAIPVKHKPSYGSVEGYETNARLMKSLLSRNSLREVGDFHSHTEYKGISAKLGLSDEDIADLAKAKSPYFFSFLMAINPSESASQGLYVRKNEIGWITKIYSRRSHSSDKQMTVKIRLKAFYLDKGKVHEAELEPSQYLTELITKNSIHQRRKKQSKINKLLEQRV